MGPAYGPMSQKLSRFRMPGQRMPSVIPPAEESEGMMPPGQGDMGMELMYPNGTDDSMVMDPSEGGTGDGQPADVRSKMGPMAARIMQVHTPAEAMAQRGYRIPGVDVPGNPSIKSPIHGSGQGADVTDIHTAQHQTIAKALNQRRWMAQQKLIQEHARLSQIVKGAKAGQNVDQAMQQLKVVEGMLDMVGKMGPTGQPGE